MERPPERRRSPRKSHKADIALLMAAGTLAGETENLSRQGILVRSDGHIVVMLKWKGRELRGRLVRVQRLDEKTFGYAVEVEGDLE